MQIKDECDILCQYISFYTVHNFYTKFSISITWAKQYDFGLIVRQEHSKKNMSTYFCEQILHMNPCSSCLCSVSFSKVMNRLPHSLQVYPLDSSTWSRWLNCRCRSYPSLVKNDLSQKSQSKTQVFFLYFSDLSPTLCTLLMWSKR